MSTSRLLGLTAALFALGIAVDLVVGYSPVPSYGAAIGLFGCLGLIWGSKLFGRHTVERSESYYPDEVPPDVEPDVRPDPAALDLRPPETPVADEAPPRGEHG